MHDINNEWEYLKSRKYCEKLFNLFGVSSVEKLKESISKCTQNHNMRYSNSFMFAPTILDIIKLDDIATLN